MDQNRNIFAEIAPYEPWIILGAVILLFWLLRLSRKALRRRVDAIGYNCFGSRGYLLWLWLNMPGVMIHELSHAIMIFVFTPFGFRITRLTLFRIQPITPQTGSTRRTAASSLQLGEVQYVRPANKIMSRIGDGLSGVAPLFGGTAMFLLLYWIATGYNLWELPLDTITGSLKILKPDWPWWTLIFAPYLILTITSELWPSRQDWRGARWFVLWLAGLLVLTIAILAYFQLLLPLLPIATFIATRVDFALIALLALDLVFILVGEILMRMVQRR